MISYFGGFLSFLGRPGPGSSLIISSADFSYKTSREIGFIPFFCSRFKTESGLISRISAISDRVYPSILIISEYIRKMLKNILKFRIFCLTYYPKYRIIKYRLVTGDVGNEQTRS